jgi:hypothetical protein
MTGITIACAFSVPNREKSGKISVSKILSVSRDDKWEV